jgi:hypothetical protein
VRIDEGDEWARDLPFDMHQAPDPRLPQDILEVENSIFSFRARLPAYVFKVRVTSQTYICSARRN